MYTWKLSTLSYLIWKAKIMYIFYFNNLLLVIMIHNIIYQFKYLTYFDIIINYLYLNPPSSSPRQGPPGRAFRRAAQAQRPCHGGAHRAGADLPQAPGQGAERIFVGKNVGISGGKCWFEGNMGNFWAIFCEFEVMKLWLGWLNPNQVVFFFHSTWVGSR